MKQYGSASIYHLSRQSGCPSMSVSVSGVPQPHKPGFNLLGSLGHWSKNVGIRVGNLVGAAVVGGSVGAS